MFRYNSLNIFDGLLAHLGISRGVLVLDLRGKGLLRRLRDAISSNCSHTNCMILVDGGNVMFTGILSVGVPLYMREGVSDTLLADPKQLEAFLKDEVHMRVYVTEDLRGPLESITKYINAMKNAMQTLTKRDAPPQDIEEAVEGVRFNTISILESFVEGLHISNITFGAITRSLNIEVFGENPHKACSILYLVSCTLSSLGTGISKASISCCRSPLGAYMPLTKTVSLERREVAKAIEVGLVLGLRYGLLLEDFSWSKEILYVFGMPTYPIEPRDLARLIKVRLAKDGIKDFPVRVIFVEIIKGRERRIDGKA